MSGITSPYDYDFTVPYTGSEETLDEEHFDHDCFNFSSMRATIEFDSSDQNNVFHCDEKFPVKIYKLLETSHIGGYSSIISWLPHGCAFKIYNEELFEKYVLKKYFLQCNVDLFKRQLYLYGFEKIGKRFVDSGAYYHENFLRGHLSLCREIA